MEDAKAEEEEWMWPYRLDEPYYRQLTYPSYIRDFPKYDRLSISMLINSCINIGIIIAIVSIIPTNPNPLFNLYAFTFILENKDWNN